MTIGEIKEQLTLATVLRHYGLKPDKSLRLQCPFHADKTPSLQVYYKTHTAYCFSSNCKTHGKALDVIDFVMHKEGCSKHEAIVKCKQLIDPACSMIATSAPRMSILGGMFTYFKNAVYNSEPAKEYIRSRGLETSQSAIGYNSGQFHHGARKDESLIKSCLDVGLLSLHDKPSRTGETAYRVFAKGCIVFPLLGPDHTVSGLYFRSITNDETERHFYLKNRKGLYPCYPDKAATRLILTEAVIDAATLQQCAAISSHYSILACYGTNGLTKEHQAAIKQLSSLQEIIFAFDGDVAGDKAVVKYATQLKEVLPGVSISKVELPAGEDINSMYISHDENVLVHLLETRTLLTSVTPSPQTPDTPELDSSNPQKLVYDTADIIYCVQGGVSKGLDSMKVMLLVESKTSGQKSRNKVDLYEDRQVAKLCKEIGERLQAPEHTLLADIGHLTDMLDTYREKELQPAKPADKVNGVYPLTIQERTAAETFLKGEGLITRLNDLLGKAGIVGEDNNRIFLLLIAISYKMREPLHALIQGSSGSGKTRLLKQISDCIPSDHVTKLTRVSDKVLYNYPEHYFVNRLLCLEDIDGLSEEAEFAFRELQSNGELNSATSIKLDNGQITSGQKTVKGPIASLACTTRGEIYEDNMSRVFLVAVDESAEQTSRIINYQNTKATGNIDSKQEQETKQFIRHLVHSLQPYEVVNPYACNLQLPPDAHKIRRLNDLFLNFVKMVTVVHQYQRGKDSKGRLIADVNDIEIAIGIMFESIVLKVDELDGSLRQFYEQLKVYVNKASGGKGSEYWFTQREVRQSLRISRSQCSRYFIQLQSLEYLVSDYAKNLRKVRYRIDYMDNYESQRLKVKSLLGNQLEEIRLGQSGTILGQYNPVQ
jgi:DNA primase